MAKPSTKKLTGAEIVASIQPKKEEIKQKEKQMKTTNPKVKTIITVLITLVSVATICGLLFAGFSIGRDYERNLNDTVTNQAKELATVISTKK